MKVVQVLEDCSISGGGSTALEFKKGLFYIISDDLHNKLKIVIGHVLGVEIPFKEIYNQYKGQDLNNRKLLALRHGGGGDILFMTTGLHELKRMYPDSSLNVAISPAYLSLVENNPNIDGVIPLPISLTEWNKYHYHIIFENIIENSFMAQEYNAYDLFMMKMGLDVKAIPPERKIPEIFINDSEIDLILKKFKGIKIGKKSIGIQAEASSPIRKYLPHNFVKVGKALINKGYELFFFGSPNQENGINYLVQQCGEGSHKVIEDLRTALVVAKHMDYFIAPDSLFIHVAGAFRIPVIGIYGPFHSDLRMKYFEQSIGINAVTNCSPCFRHGFHPCIKGDPSPCLSLITSKHILQAFDELVVG